ncbi:MAG: PA14 domain-containing protein [Bacteroidota bacterium]
MQKQSHEKIRADSYYIILLIYQLEAVAQLHTGSFSNSLTFGGSILPGGGTNLYSKIDGTSVSFQFSWDSDPPGVYSSHDTGSLSGLSNGISWMTSGMGSGVHTLTVSLNGVQEVTDLGFDITHITYGVSAGDKVTVSALTKSGSSISPTYTQPSNADYTLSGNVADAFAYDSSPEYNLGVNLSASASDPIASFSVSWQECSICSPGNTSHGIGFSDIEFNAVGIDTDNDGLVDLDDLDDDNDGILDTDESCTGTAPTTADITINILLDSYGEETAWSLSNSGGTIASVSTGTYAANDNQLITYNYTGAFDDYTFTLTDSYGDGICCSYGSGYYEILVDGVSVAGGSGSSVGVFSFSTSENFTVSAGSSNFFCLNGDPANDEDGDGIINYRDSDFCTLNANGVCSSLDDDGDGIINSMDLDSDGDGDKDAMEGGGSYLFANLDASGRVAASVDGDGIPGGSSQAVGSSQTSSSQTDEYDACNSNSSFFSDADGDGIGDACDLDDDNDGISDLDEGCYGSGTLSAPFTNLYMAHAVPHSGRYYFDLGDGVFHADVDTSNGGGWVLILQYVHQGGDNSALTVIGAGSNLPSLNTATLGTNQAGTSDWGHLGNSGFTALGAEELRWYASTTAHSRIIHFRSTVGISYAETGSGSFLGINTSNNKLTGHTSNIPDVATNTYSDEGDYALTNFPFWLWGTYHWGIRGLNSRWEVDDYAGGSSESTIHRIWARANTAVSCSDTDSDGTADYLDLDSDNDGCWDALEGAGSYAYADINSSGVLTASVASNGIPGSSSQAIGSSQDNTSRADECDICNSSSSLFSDNDGDGIGDLCDLDDDNDGILDTDEGSTCPGNLNFEFYDAAPSGNTVENIPTTGATAEGIINEINITNLQTTYTPSDADTYSIRYTGKIYIETSDTYTFYTSSDDGSKLSINGNQVSINDGLHGTTETNGSVYLVQGFHDFEALFFEYTGGASFTWSYSSGSISKQTVPMSILYPSTCSGQDTDADGTFDHLDLDSDADGCWDALEGTASYTYTDVSNAGVLTAGVAANGIPGGSSQAIGSSQDANTQADECDPCNSNSSLFSDFDGDGLGDICDLDDDNDAILDSDECQFGTNLTANPGFELGNTGFTSDNTYFGDCTGGGSQAPNSYSVLSGDANSCNSGWAGTATEGSSFAIFDFPSTNIQQNFWCQTVAVSPLTEYFFSAEFINVLVIHDQVDPVMGFYITDNSTGIEYFLGSSADQVSLTENSGWQEAGFSFITSSTATNYTVCLRNISYGYSGNDMGMDNIRLRSLDFNTDTDGDGTSNYQDLDSDNDGCWDALEGAGSFSYTDINSSGVLTATVGSNGIPGGSSQAIGSSQDINTQADECNPCNSSSSLFSDNDGDGLGDNCDLDDDNDGIVDATECGSGSANLALAGTISMSSNYNGTLVGSKANDGNTGASEAHTAGSTAYDWIELDLGSTNYIDEIVIWNRTSCCTNRLGNVYVMASTTAFPSSTDLSAAQANAEYTYQLGSTDGVNLLAVPIERNVRYIRLQKSGTNPGGNWLNIYELQAINYSLCDTDSDSHTDQLDTDSDGDECWDALEGGGSYTYSDIDTNGALSTSVDGDGIPGGSSQSLGSAQDNTTQSDECNACNINSSLFVDTDGDGIGNACDLDDDNDGLPDIDEETDCTGGGIVVLQPFFLETFGTGGNTDFAGAGVTATTTYNYAGVNGQVPDGDYQIMSEYYSAMYQYYANPTSTDGPADPLFEDHTSGDVNGRLAVFNAATGGEFFVQPVSITENGTYRFAAYIANINAFPVKPDITIEILDPSNVVVATKNTGILPDYTTAAAAWQEYSLDFNATTVGTYTLKFKNNSTSGLGNDVAFDDISFAKISYDCDNDGITNSLDLDSDNDGIWDGTEGGHGQSIGTDGRISGATSGSGANGLYDGVESSAESASINYSISDNESSPDGIYDFIDIDADGDGCYDTQEARISDADADGRAGNGSPSVDANGLVSGITYSVPASSFWQNSSKKRGDCNRKVIQNRMIMNRAKN